MVVNSSPEVDGRAPLPPALEARSLCKEVSSPEGLLTILDSVSFTVLPAETVAIVGPSGAGKSTLLSLLAGLDVPTRGTVRLCGSDLSGEDEDGRARLRAAFVGFVFQSFHLLPSLTAVEQVMLPLELSGVTDARERAVAALNEVGLEARLRHYPRQLSGGEQQRVAIARALVNTPELVLLDEPTGDLDTRNTVAVMDLLLRINLDAGVTLVMVTHNPDLECYADRVVYVADGRVVGTAVNTVQTPLEHEAYLAYLHREADGDADA